MASLTVQNGGVPHKRAKNSGLNTVAVVIGAQWGDEGKGKIVDILASHSDIVCRAQVSSIGEKCYVLYCVVC